MIKLIAVDMDDTLLDKDKRISPANIAAIQQAANAGVKIVLCTGRILSGVKPYFEQLGLSADQEYVIINNGCAVHQTSDWRLVESEALTTQEITYLADFAQKGKLPLTLCDVEHYYVVEDEANSEIVADCQNIFLQPRTIALKDIATHDQPFFLAKFVGNENFVAAFKDKHDQQLSQDFNTVLSQPTIYECLPKGVSKATGLKKLAARLNILPEEIMAIGDGNNDLEMFAFAGLSIAMDNASDAVKAAADHITTSHQEDGVAHAIERFVLAQ